MKTLVITAQVVIGLGLIQTGWAQSTTGSRSGGSSASTGAGYESNGRRPAETSANSLTIADEGASRDYMYVPPKPAKNRAASPTGSSQSSTRQTTTSKSTGSSRKSARKQHS